MRGNKFVSFLVLSLALTAFLAGYIMVKRGVDSGPKTGTILDKFAGQTTDEQLLELEKEANPTLLTDRQVTYAVNSSTAESVLYYEKNTGKIFELNINDKSEQIISEKTFTDITSVLWSPNRKETLNFINPPTGNSLNYYNLRTSTSSDLGTNIQAAAFSPDSNLVALYYFDEESQSGKIMISQPDGLYQKKVLNTRLKNISLYWPTKDDIALKTGSNIYLLNERSGAFTKLIEGGPGFEEKWSPSGNKLLFSVFSENPENPDIVLWLKNIKSKKTTSANIPGLARNCVWSVDDIHIFCAIPDSSSTDIIFKIRTDDWAFTIVAEPAMIIKDLFLSNLEDNLMFISAVDEKLYSIKISD